MAAHSTTEWYGCPLLSQPSWWASPPLSLPILILNMTWSFLCDLISGPSYNKPHLPVSCIFSSSQLPSLVRARGPVTQGLPGRAFTSPGFATSHWMLSESPFAWGSSTSFPSGKTWLSTCHCNAKYLKHSMVPSPFPYLPTTDYGDFRGPLVCTLFQECYSVCILEKDNLPSKGLFSSHQQFSAPQFRKGASYSQKLKHFINVIPMETCEEKKLYWSRVIVYVRIR